MIIRDNNSRNNYNRATFAKTMIELLSILERKKRCVHDTRHLVQSLLLQERITALFRSSFSNYPHPFLIYAPLSH